MAHLGNTPGAPVFLRAEARKSFSFGLLLADPHGRPMSLEGCELIVVAGGPDRTNLLEADSRAIIEHPEDGYARFDLQAATLDLRPGEYPLAVVLRTPEGYTSLLVKGELEVLENVDYSGAESAYDSASPAQWLTVLLREENVVSVRVGGQLPPGMAYVPEELLPVLETLHPESVARLPRGGVPGYVLTKTDDEDFAAAWRPDTGGSGLTAIGQSAGRVPTSLGDGTWDWREPSTPEIPAVDWAAADDAPGAIRNKPSLGSAAAADTEDFVSADTLVSELPGIHFVTSVPTTGEDGHLYFVYEA